MQNGSSNENVIRKKTSNKEINILEWNFLERSYNIVIYRTARERIISTHKNKIHS